jgi:hypothetical protein
MTNKVTDWDLCESVRTMRAWRMGELFRLAGHSYDGGALKVQHWSEDLEKAVNYQGECALSNGD